MSEDNKNELEKLLEIASSPLAPSEKPPYQSDCTRFINHFDLKSGPHKLRSEVIYRMYKSWKPKDRQSRRDFLIDFGKEFEKFTSSDYIYYLLDLTDLVIPEEIIQKVKKPIIMPKEVKDVTDDEKSET